MHMRTSLAALTSCAGDTRGHEPVPRFKVDLGGNMRIPAAGRCYLHSSASSTIMSLKIYSRPAFPVRRPHTSFGLGAPACRGRSVRVGTNRCYPGLGSQL